MLTLQSIQAARERIAGRVHLTPTMSAARLGERAGVALTLKCELLQKTGSFKARGALNHVAQLGPEARVAGVITVSAGNHGQALAWAAQAAGVPCTVVMPATASITKVDATRGYGAEVVLHGESSIEAFARGDELAAERGLTFVHPFDDEWVAAGAGTVGLEILEQVPDVDAIVVAIGGGGLISGIATAVKALRPSVAVYGVEPEGAAVLRKSLDAGQPVRLDRIATLADGLAAPMAGKLTFDVVSRLVNDVVVVSDDEIVDAMRSLLANTKLMAEGAGAAATAAVLSGRLPLSKGSSVVSVLSGGNVDLASLRELL